jgi:CHRD domain
LFAHIHLGQRATTGGVIAFLCGGQDKPACPDREGTVTGVIDAADVSGPADQGIAAGELTEAIRALRAGAVYANVHTEKYRSGEIRGQVGSKGHKGKNGKGKRGK